ncbi:hypothetical protein BD626DRAFT_617694, partial [Schizophyllum amplum]
MSGLRGIWEDAVNRYERDTGEKLLLADFDDTSNDGCLLFIEQRSRDFDDFRARGPERLRKHLVAICNVVQPLCGCLGDLTAVAVSPLKGIFGAIGVIMKAATDVSADYDAIVDVFETMADIVRMVKPISGSRFQDTLREPTVKLFAQILMVLGVVSKLQREGRFKTWIKKFRQDKDVSHALKALQQLAQVHHETVSSVTLHAIEEVLAMLGSSSSWAETEQQMTRECLKHIGRIASDLHGESYVSSAAVDRRVLEDIQRVLLLHTEKCQRASDDTALRSLLQWLPYPDPNIKLNSALRSRLPGTGAWFLDGNTFAAFKSFLERQTLWLHGKAGSGKSTLLAAAIQDMRAHCAASGPGLVVAFHFFDATDSTARRDLRELISSFLCQLAYEFPDALPLLSLGHGKHKYGGSQASLDTLQHYLNMLLAAPTRFFFAVDALDESDDSDIITFLNDIAARANVSLIMTSRAEVSFRQDLISLSSVQVDMDSESVNCDILLLINDALRPGGILKRAKDGALIRQTLNDGADGNFRWAALQLQALQKVSSIPLLVQRTLSNMPSTLSGIYALHLERLSDVAKTIRYTLAWLLFSRRPLSVNAFAETLAFDYADGALPVFDRSLRPSSTDEVLALVGSVFVTVRKDGSRQRCVYVAHASVREYLLALPPTSNFYLNAYLASSIL